MNKLMTSLALATSLAACGAAAAKDNGPLAKVYPVQEMHYAYSQANPLEAKAEAARVESDRLVRASEVLKSGASLDLKRAAVEDLVNIQQDGATRALAGAYKQSVAMHDIDVEAYVANAIWRHAAQREFKSREANALMAQLSNSQYARVRMVGKIGQADAVSYAKRNSN